MNVEYNVALVDDEAEVSEQLEKMIAEYGSRTGIEFVVSKFNNTSEFISAHPDNFVIVFMDINIPNDINGMKAIKKLRAMGSKAVVIFCTRYAQYAINGYEVGALNYLIKPLREEVFVHTMDRAMRALRRLNINKMVIKTVDGQKFVNISDIVYIEVMVHNLYFHIKKGEGEFVVERSRGVLNDIADKLADMYFARGSACYLINLAHVVSVNKKIVYLSSGDSLALGRKFAKEFMNKLMQYMAEFSIIDG